MNQTQTTNLAVDDVNDGKKEIVFIDTSLTDYQTLAAAIRPGVEIKLIGGGDDGLAQMANWAQTHSGYDAIHLISHGAPGMVQIGSNNMIDASNGYCWSSINSREKERDNG